VQAATIHRAPALQPLAGALRVSGRLLEDARLVPGTGLHSFLFLRFQPQGGVPYECRADLGTDVADHMAAEALLPHMRTGAVVSAAAEALRVRMDHGHEALLLVNPHSVLLLQDPVSPPVSPTATVPQPQEA
jgi:hypothetical protein